MKTKLKPGTEVLLHRHVKSGRWTVFESATGKHLGYVDQASLTDVTFVIDPERRKKSKDSGQRTVHAYVLGKIAERGARRSGSKVKYNPWDNRGFINQRTKKEVAAAKAAYFCKTGDVRCRRTKAGKAAKP